MANVDFSSPCAPAAFLCSDLGLSLGPAGAHGLEESIYPHKSWLLTLDCFSTVKFDNWEFANVLDEETPHPTLSASRGNGRSRRFVVKKLKGCLKCLNSTVLCYLFIGGSMMGVGLTIAVLSNIGTITITGGAQQANSMFFSCKTIARLGCSYGSFTKTK